MPKSLTITTRTRLPLSSEGVLGLRAMDGHLETAINTFRHDDGRTITVVGIEHLGTEEYFATLLETVEKLAADGATVRAESLHAGDWSINARNDEERAGVAALSESLSNRHKIFDELGLPWISQDVSVMAHKDEWARSAISILDIVRVLGPTFTIARLNRERAFQAKVERAKENGGVMAIKVLRRKAISQMLTRARAVRKGKISPDWWDQRVAYAWRECEELRTVLAAESDQVMIWGAPHMRAFAEGLRRNGFDLADTDWIPVWAEMSKALPVPIAK